MSREFVVEVHYENKLGLSLPILDQGISQVENHDCDSFIKKDLTWLSISTDINQ